MRTKKERERIGSLVGLILLIVLCTCAKCSGQTTAGCNTCYTLEQKQRAQDLARIENRTERKEAFYSKTGAVPQKEDEPLLITRMRVIKKKFAQMKICCKQKKSRHPK